MLNALSFLSPTTIKAAGIAIIIGIIMAGGFVLGSKLKEAQVKQFEIAALECEKRGKEREIEIATQALEAEKRRLEYEKELTARIEDELRKNGKLSKQLEEAIKNQKVVNREVVKYVTNEIQKTVYSECVVPPSGVSALVQAARDYNTARNASPSNNSKN